MLAASLLVLMQAHVGAGQVRDGTTTRYWDCAKPTCAWVGKAQVNRPVLTCAKDGFTPVDAGTPSGVAGGNAYKCSDQQPMKVNDQFSYGFAAASSSLERDSCCACYLLTFKDTKAAGKKMLVQVASSGSDISTNNFDLEIPGGGVGFFNGCRPQWGAPADGWGALFGGVASRKDCALLPSQLQPGCFWRFDWLQDAQNPTITSQRFRCPAELTNRSRCIRDDDANYPYYNPLTGPSFSWVTTKDGIWAPGCDFTGADLSSARTTGEQCSGKCRATSGCTHYTWTNFNGGTCWMKKGAAFKADAVATGNNNMVCGIMPWITWSGKWANGCDFKGGDFKKANATSSTCGSKCASTAGCTHYSWNNSTCWLKQGNRTKANATSTYDDKTVCGLM